MYFSAFDLFLPIGMIVDIYLNRISGAVFIKRLPWKNNRLGKVMEKG